MAKTTLKKRLRKLLRSPKLLLIFSVIIVLAVTLVFENKGLWRHVQLQHEVNKQRSKEAELDTAEHNLSKQVDQLQKEDPATIERVARERYGMKRPGEVIYRADSK
jgi:cell division protein FtsB